MATKTAAKLLPYGERERDLVERIRGYLTQVQSALGKRPLILPDVRPVVDRDVLPPWGDIAGTRSAGEDRFRLGWDFVAARFGQRPNTAQGSERYYDPMFFVVLLIMVLGGGVFRHQRTKVLLGERERWLLQYEGIKPKGKPQQFLRTIADAQPGREARQNGHPTAAKEDRHYDSRRVTLKVRGKAAIREANQLARNKGHQTRDHAIRRAVELFEEQIRLHGVAALLNMDAHAYEALLREAMALADRVYATTAIDRGLPSDWDDLSLRKRQDWWGRERRSIGG